MNGLKNFIAALIFLSALDTNAQYQLLVKGERSIFDTAVAVQIDRFRMESDKFDLGDALIDSLKFELFKALQINHRKDTLITTLAIKVANLSAGELRRDATIDQLDHTFDFLSDEALKPKILFWNKPIWKKPSTWFSLGGITGIILTSLLLK